jgi:hypothetical protein
MQPIENLEGVFKSLLFKLKKMKIIVPMENCLEGKEYYVRH